MQRVFTKSARRLTFPKATPPPAAPLPPPPPRAAAAVHLIKLANTTTFSSSQWQRQSALNNAFSLSGEYFRIARNETVSFSTEATTLESAPTEAVKELYDKILESVNIKRTMAPNAWLWSLIENCRNREDIKLLFLTLENLRRFRLSNLRIHANFNDNLCREVAKACTRVGASDFGKRALWKHNVYGLTPSVASANHLLSYAENHNDVNLMVDVMKLMKRNDIELQPSTADIVFRVCAKSDNWELISKYSKKFLKAGVKLRKTAYDTWMDFAAKRGDTKSLWEVEKLRSETYGKHTLLSGFSSAKGLLLERKPEDAAALIHVLQQTLPDNKKSNIIAEIQNLVSNWPFEVLKHQEGENKKALATALKSDIPAMITSLSTSGFEVNVNLEDLTGKEKLLS